MSILKVYKKDQAALLMTRKRHDLEVVALCLQLPAKVSAEMSSLKTSAEVKDAGLSYIIVRSLFL